MNIKSAIKSLYWALIDENNNYKPEGELYEKAYRQQFKALEEFEKSLSAEQMLLFEDYVDKNEKMQVMKQEEAYVYGFSLGLRIAAETYRNGKSDIVSVFEE